MIDTISITIPESDFRIMDHNRFSPSTYNLYFPPYIRINGRSPFKSVNNPSKKDIEKHGYLPRLTLFKAIRRGGFALFLKVEFSIPKLLFGNNFEEVEESNFGEICWKIMEVLGYMGIEIRSVKTIAYADVSTIHYSKNILLKDYSTPYSILKEIEKLNINKLFDMSRTDFRNEGHSIKYHSNDFEVILYDKLKDLQQSKKSEKRAIEKDNYIQLSLFDSVTTLKPFEVLRLEVRIGTRKKMKQLLKKHKFEHKKLSFNDLFSKEVSKTILMSIVEEFEEAYPKILLTKNGSYEELLVELQLGNPGVGYRKLLAFVV